MEKKTTELRFLGKIGIFCVPLIIFLGFPILVLYRSGEFISFDTIFTRETGGESLIVGPVYSNPVYYLNIQSVIIKKPQVLVIGSSRTNQIRSDFFNATITEYTAGTMISEMDQFKEFMDKVPTSSDPKILMLGLDQKFFDPNYDPASYGPEDLRSVLAQPQNPVADVIDNWWPHWFTIYGYMASQKLTLGDLIHPNSSLVGLFAVVDHKGFRNDGSYNPGDNIYLLPSQDETYTGIAQGVRGFEYSNVVSQNALDQLDAFLAECKAKNIYVIGFVPPFSPTIYAMVNSMGDKYGYLPKISSDTTPLFKKYGFGFYDFGNPQSIGAAESDMKDGIHLTERGSIMMVEKMAATDKILAQYVDANYLKSILASTNAPDNDIPSASSTN